MFLKPAFTPAPSVKVMLNIGALLDIPTGFYLIGLHNESILNGGLGTLTGVAGIGNNFKSAIMHYMILSGAAKVFETTDTSISTYDTEINVHEDTLRRLASKMPTFASRDIIDEQLWAVTDKTIYYANKWYEILKQFLRDKKANAKKIELATPFPSRDKKTPLMIATPTFGEIDSFSDFETEDVADMRNKNELGESGGNTQHMRQGLSKTAFLMEIPALAGGAYHYLAMTAQLGKDIPMASGPMPAPPVKKLQHLKNGDKLKGVTDKFTFLMNNCWHAYNAAPLTNQGTRGPEYPRDPDDNMVGDTDLNVVCLRQLRGKSGPTGIVLEILVSQADGVLPSLTEFHYIKGQDRFGISGTMQHYSLDLLPEVKLSRTTVRNKLDTDPMLRRAMNITSELCQMKNYWHNIQPGLLITPKELYERLKARGYDWDLLLKTRGWWTFDNDKHPIPFLSTMDLLRMATTGPLACVPEFSYHPYWYPVKVENLKPIP